MFNLFKSVMGDSSGDEPPQRCTAVIVAAGRGERMRQDTSKQFIKLIGRPVISYTLEVFEQCKMVDEIIIVTREQDLMDMRDVVEAFGIDKAAKIVIGGDRRQDSVYNGLSEIGYDTSTVLIHDGARPFVTVEELETLIKETGKYQAAALGMPVKDTVKKVDKDNIVTETPDRETLWAVATPQAFAHDVIMNAYEAAMKDKFYGTDDCSLVERTGHSVKIVPCSNENIKITTPEDIFVAESILESRGDEW